MSLDAARIRSLTLARRTSTLPACVPPPPGWWRAGPGEVGDCLGHVLGDHCAQGAAGVVREGASLTVAGGRSSSGPGGDTCTASRRAPVRVAGPCCAAQQGRGLRAAG